MKNSETLFVDDIDVSSLFLEKEGKIRISSKNRIMHACKPFGIFFVDPFLFSLLSVNIGLDLCLLLVLL